MNFQGILYHRKIEHYYNFAYISGKNGRIFMKFFQRCIFGQAIKFWKSSRSALAEVCVFRVLWFLFTALHGMQTRSRDENSVSIIQYAKRPIFVHNRTSLKESK